MVLEELRTPDSQRRAAWGDGCIPARPQGRTAPSLRHDSRQFETIFWAMPVQEAPEALVRRRARRAPPCQVRLTGLAVFFSSAAARRTGFLKRGWRQPAKRSPRQPSFLK